MGRLLLFSVTNDPPGRQIGKQWKAPATCYAHATGASLQEACVRCEGLRYRKSEPGATGCAQPWGAWPGAPGRGRLARVIVELGAQRSAHDLPGRRERQALHEVNLPRILVRREPRLHVLLNLAHERL